MDKELKLNIKRYQVSITDDIIKLLTDKGLVCYKLNDTSLFFETSINKINVTYKIVISNVQKNVDDLHDLAIEYKEKKKGNFKK